MGSPLDGNKTPPNVPDGAEKSRNKSRNVRTMCNLYSHHSNLQATTDLVGTLQPGLF